MHEAIYRADKSGFEFESTVVGQEAVRWSMVEDPGNGSLASGESSTVLRSDSSLRGPCLASNSISQALKNFQVIHVSSPLSG